MRAGPGGWAEGCGGLGALPPPATPDPAALAERGLHLLGYDHERSQEDEEAQCLAQREIMDKVKL